MARESIQKLLGTITPDPWRPSVGLTPDLAAAQERMFATSNDAEIAAILNEWLQRHQPCLFGRLAARCNQLSYCILSESDLAKDDVFIRDKIQHYRTSWTRDSYKGERSGFIILAVSKNLAHATPDSTIAQIAQRLAELYLLDEVAFDDINLEEIFLEQPGNTPATWRWDAGINYFATHGDKRWWHDHRIPGGIGFSINSVGHMAKSGLMRNALAKLGEVLETNEGEQAKSKVESLTKALELAMTTIDRAQDTVSGKATHLIPLPTNPPAPLPPRPSLPDFLDGKNHCEYFGYYHTDFTLPSEYFRPDVERPADIQGHPLDFTYLFDDNIDNPAYITMGKGRRVRKWGDGRKTDESNLSPRITKMIPVSVPVSDVPRLKGIA